ncbi:MAG: hypothetical protein IJ600_02590 [Lachnospiraceae bacterium]|nr:hypothetical protein [Lachnospiraceae bacterium]
MFVTRKKTSRFLRAVCAFVLALGILAAFGTFRAWAAGDDFDITATANVSGGNTANVVITITNNGKDFGGYVRLCVGQSYTTVQNHAAYESYISIAEGETETLTISFPVMENDSLEDVDIEIQMLNDRKKLLQISKQRHLFDVDNNLHYGTLCSDASALDFLGKQSGYGYGYYGSAQQQWEGENLMPSELTDGMTLNSLSMLFIDDFDVSSLKEEERTAIENWVQNGGILVIGTGEFGDETFAAFDPALINASLASLSPYEDYSYYANYGYITFSDIGYGSDYNASMAREAMMRQAGRGGVVVLQFSMTDDELDQEYFRDDIFSEPLMMLRSGNTRAYKLSSDYELERTFGVMQGQAGLNGALLSAIIVAYVILVGPVLYLVLKKYDKREKIWYAVPMMSLVFVMIVFVASRGFSVRNRMFESIRVAKADGSGNEADYIFGFSSGQKPWTINLGDDVQAAGPINLSSNGYLNAEVPHCLVSRSPKGLQVQYSPYGVFENVYLKTLQPNAEKYGDLDFDVELKRSGISGKISNDTDRDFAYVLVVCNGYYQIIPDLESGESYTLSGQTRTQYNNESDISNLARRLYDQKDYKGAKLHAALFMAAHELQNEAVFVVGVSTAADKVLSGVGNSEEAFLCLYNTK